MRMSWDLGVLEKQEMSLKGKRGMDQRKNEGWTKGKMRDVTTVVEDAL